MYVEDIRGQHNNSIYHAGTGWIGQEGDRKRKEIELQRKLDPNYNPGSSSPPPKGEKYVFVGIALGLLVGGLLGLFLGLSIDLLKPVFWVILSAIFVAIVGGVLGDRIRKRMYRKHNSNIEHRGI
jgi:hypothetical protein